MRKRYAVAGIVVAILVASLIVAAGMRAPSDKAGSLRVETTSWNVEGAWCTNQAMLSRLGPRRR